MSFPTPPNTQGMPLIKAVEEMRKFEANLSPTELRDFKRHLMKPYRKKNMLLAGAMFTAVASIYAFSMYKTKQDDFSALDDQVSN
jgi:lambda repressor-like predicted transcriptional regulator